MNTETEFALPKDGAAYVCTYSVPVDGYWRCPRTTTVGIKPERIMRAYDYLKEAGLKVSFMQAICDVHRPVVHEYADQADREKLPRT